MPARRFRCTPRWAATQSASFRSDPRSSTRAPSWPAPDATADAGWVGQSEVIQRAQSQTSRRVPAQPEVLPRVQPSDALGLGAAITTDLSPRRPTLLVFLEVVVRILQPEPRGWAGAGSHAPRLRRARRPAAGHLMARYSEMKPSLNSTAVQAAPRSCAELALAEWAPAAALRAARARSPR